MDMKDSRAFWSRKRTRGQSIVEFALMAPILLIILSGLFEFGFLFTYYLSVLDAGRNSARFSSDSLYETVDNDTDCNTTKDFYRQTSCMAISELANEQPTIRLCLWNAPATQHCSPHTWSGNDDVIVSVFSVLREGGTTVIRFPNDGSGESGWSYDSDLRYGPGNQTSGRTGMHVSSFTTGKILSMLQSGTPNTGYVLVEINYNYHQILGMPWFTQFVADPVPFHIYALWPCVSAEPTSTI
jgi:hypothetical protein